jgi:hypothetical protein
MLRQSFSHAKADGDPDSLPELKYYVLTQCVSTIIIIVHKLWERGGDERVDAHRLLELTRPGRGDGALDAIDGLACAGFPLSVDSGEVLAAVTRALAETAPPPLPAREVWPKMSGPTRAKWHLVCACMHRSIGHKAEMFAEYRKAASGGNEFAWISLSGVEGAKLRHETRLWEAVEAGHASACGLLARGLSSASGATARRRLLNAGALGVERKDVWSIIAMSRDLTRRGRRVEAGRLLRKLDDVPIYAHYGFNAVELDAFVKARQRRAAMRFLGRLSRAGAEQLRIEFFAELEKDDPQGARAIWLMRVENLRVGG